MSENLIAIITDIREKSGVGAKPMLSKLADAIASALAASEHRGVIKGLEMAREMAAASLDASESAMDEYPNDCDYHGAMADAAEEIINVITARISAPQSEHKEGNGG